MKPAYLFTIGMNALTIAVVMGEIKNLFDVAQTGLLCLGVTAICLGFAKHDETN